MKAGFKGVLWLVVLFVLNNVYAGEKTFLTADKLIENGYVKLTGEQIFELMAKKVIEVTDIETDAVTISRRAEKTRGMERDFGDEKGGKSLYFLDPRLLARAPPLEGKIERKVVGDELVSTDGLRTYKFSVYEKQGRIFAVRDIDHGNVYYEVKFK